MNKEHFNQLVGDYSKLENQFNDLEKLIAEYPYSQPVRMLGLKSSVKLDKREFQKRLALAAFYVTDRNVLRSLIETGRVSSDVVKGNGPGKAKKTPKPPPPPPAGKKVKPAINAESLRQEVLANLTLLQETKTTFLKLADLEPAKAATKGKKPARQIKAEPPVTKVKAKSPAAKPVPKPGVKGGTGRAAKKEIIDKFIANEPSITPKKTLPDNQHDLSKASSELKEDLVSENLAVIFAKQGKTSKAIEIYKKLIWKFPQKKASFAARIEELKKK